MAITLTLPPSLWTTAALVSGNAPRKLRATWWRWRVWTSRIHCACAYWVTSSAIRLRERLPPKRVSPIRSRVVLGTTWHTIRSTHNTTAEQWVWRHRHRPWSPLNMAPPEINSWRHTLQRYLRHHTRQTRAAYHSSIRTIVTWLPVWRACASAEQTTTRHRWLVRRHLCCRVYRRYTLSFRYHSVWIQYPCCHQQEHIIRQRLWRHWDNPRLSNHIGRGGRS